MRVRTILACTLMFIMVATVGFGQGRTERGTVPYSETGFLVGECDGFQILVDWSGLFTFVDLYDKDGMWVRSVAHERVLGQGVYYNSENPAKSVLGGPGEGVTVRWDPATGRRYGSGMSWKVKVPGYGLIFAESGLHVFQCEPYTFRNCELVSNVGHNQFRDPDLAALCDYLR